MLDGEKAKGEWALIRIRSNEEKNQWLLLKATKSIKPISKKRDDESVISGRTMKQIADDRDAEWESDRDEPTNKSAVSDFKSRIRETLKKKESRKVGRDGPSRRRKEKVARGESDNVAQVFNLRSGNGQVENLPHNLPAGKPRFIEPMKARLSEKPPTAGDWIYELKFDGFRLLAIRKGKSIELKSRNKNDLSARFSDLIEPLRALPAREFVLDGEAVALDDEGRSSFQCLQAREMESRETADLFLSLRHFATRRQRPNESAVARSQSDPGKVGERRGRSAPFFGRAWRRSEKVTC